MEISMKNNLYIRESLPLFKSDLSPSEKLDTIGVESLWDGELLMACLGLSQDKVKEVMENHSLAKLASLPLADLKNLMGAENSRKLATGFELSRRAFDKGLGLRPSISCPSETIPFLNNIKLQKKEHFLCLYLNARHQVVHTEVVSVGSLSASIVHPREVFLPAISHSSASIILSHNHPSGDPSPSKEDIELTKRLIQAGEIIGIEILDHIILGSSEFISLKEKGLMG
jgi:DNA repair protein RadC